MVTITFPWKKKNILFLYFVSFSVCNSDLISRRVLLGGEVKKGELSLLSHCQKWQPCSTGTEASGSTFGHMFSDSATVERLPKCLTKISAERDEREGQRAKTFFLSRNGFHVFLLSGNHTVCHLHTVDIFVHSVASAVSVAPSQSEEWNVSRTGLCSEECAATPVQPAEVSDATSHPVWQPVLLTAHR